MNLFGFEIVRKTDPAEEQAKQPAFAPEIKDDGAVVVAAGGAYGTYIDLQGAARTEAELVTKYREMSMHPEVERASDDIVNEAIVVEDKTKIVQVNLDNTDLSTNIKKLITKEFENVLSLLDFNKSAYDIFKRWYVDGRMYYHVIIDITKPGDGIKELRYIDPRKLRKIREVKRKRDSKAQVTQTETVQEYFIYNEKGFQNKAGEVGTATAVQGLKIAPDSIVHVTSGLLDPMNSVVLGHLHKAIKPLNQLRALEDATIVYRISRAPERRIFYIDVGNLPKMKAEQYLRDMMTRHKNKVVYDASTGEIRDDRKFMTMLEDYWLPRRDGSRGTEITTLPAGQNLGKLEDVEYFQKKLYESLNVPASRLQQDGAFIFGQDQEISRDEIKFSKYIERLRMRFNHLFLGALEKQLILKKVITEEDWELIETHIKFDYAQDNYFEQQKSSTTLKERLSSLDQITPYVGKYYSNEWVRKHVLYQSDEEIEEMDEQNMAEQENPFHQQPGVDENGNPVQGGNAPPGMNTAQGPGGGGFGSTAPTEQAN
jgi:hypothetical protein